MSPEPAAQNHRRCARLGPAVTVAVVAVIEVFAREDFTTLDAPVVFLAGPTPRSPSTASWRPAMIAALETAGFEGVVLNPESRPGTTEYIGLNDEQWAAQHDWEWAGLDAADVIVFWVPRSLPDMPAFTTNVEFGLHARSGRVVLGYPQGSANNRYLGAAATKLGIPLSFTMTGTAQSAIAMLRGQR